MLVSRSLFFAGLLLLFCILPSAALPDNGTHGIRFQSIPDLQQRDVHTVIAVTDLPVGTEILYEIYVQRRCPKAGCGGQNWGAVGTLYVQNGTGSLNQTSFVIDASTLRPDEYLVTENAVFEDATGSVFFNVIDSPDNPYWITYDITPAGYAGEPLEIAGTTNLPAGEVMFYSLLQVKEQDTIPVPVPEEGLVMPGENGLNRTLFLMENGTPEPGEYRLTSIGTGHYATGNTTFRVLPARTAPTVPGFGWLAGAIGLGSAGLIEWRRTCGNGPGEP